MSRDTYAIKALEQIPRLLGNLDRQKYSPTYGCFHRDYWLEKTSDFPDAVRQFAVQSLALVYCHNFPGNIYKGNPLVREWSIAGMLFWASIQHNEGSFDEFYPFERGWVGPTAFTTFAIIEAYELLKQEMTQADCQTIETAIFRAAEFIAKGESEEDHLANHHAMACLALAKANQVINKKELEIGYQNCFKNFLKYQTKEGWSIEYDGIDPGYLSATISFLAKIYQIKPDPKIKAIAQKSIEICSFFSYPNGFFAGSMGSRNTLHFYSHGFEVFGKEIPLALSIAECMLIGLGQGKLVPPSIMSDRYVAYRVPEYLQSFIDYTERKNKAPLLPYEKKIGKWYFPEAGIWSKKHKNIFILCNLAKGGVVKVFDTSKNKLIHNDCGVIGSCSQDKVITSQWLDQNIQMALNSSGWEVSGTFHKVPANKIFTPFKNIVFRLIMLLIGWSPSLCHWVKGKIRKTLMLGQRPVNAKFTRALRVFKECIELETTVRLTDNMSIKGMSIGGEFFVRYVPQSRYFQSQELDIIPFQLNEKELCSLNKNRVFKHVKKIRLA